jgi:hypothetical protein
MACSQNGERIVLYTAGGGQRPRRAATLVAPDEARTKRMLLQRSADWAEIANRLRDHVERLLSVRVLHAADAFQLAAALVSSRGKTTRRRFVSFDDRLRTAAAREGFDVLPDADRT